MNQNVLDSIWRGIYLVERECQRKADAGEIVNIVSEVLEENKITQKIIAKGMVTHDLTDPTLIILITDDRAEHWMLPGWASPHIGKRLTISVEESNDKEK